MNLVTLAEQIAREAHAGQLRMDGTTPYIVHPEAVHKNVVTLLGEPEDRSPLHISLNGYFAENKLARPMEHISELYEVIEALAWIHDVVEDNPNFTPLRVKNILRSEGIKDYVIDVLLEGLLSITKPKDLSYLLYIIMVRNNAPATFVKLADIQHNLSDLKPGSLRDKYELARYVLLDS